MTNRRPNAFEGQNGANLNSLAQEELINAGPMFDPYNWESKEGSNPRLSKMMEAPPSTAFDRRLSRLPPGINLQDPFGYGVAAESSPYDGALAYSSHTSNPSKRQSMLGLNGSAAPGPSSRPVSSWSTSDLPAWDRTKRSSSFGDIQNSGYRTTSASPTRPAHMPSKLSGEVDSQNSSLPNFIPTDNDYLHSKLYQRTLKAQKALEREKAKAIAKGKLPPDGSLGVNAAGRMSRMSIASDGASLSDGRSRRMSLGWFRSRSEVALSAMPGTPPLPSSLSSATLPIPPPQAIVSTRQSSQESAEGLRPPSAYHQPELLAAPVIHDRGSSPTNVQSSSKYNASTPGSVRSRSPVANAQQHEKRSSSLSPAQEPKESKNFASPTSVRTKPSREHLTPAMIPLPPSAPPTPRRVPNQDEANSPYGPSPTQQSEDSRARQNHVPKVDRPYDNSPPAQSVPMSSAPSATATRNGSTESEREPALGTSSIDSVDSGASRTSPVTPASSAMGHQNGPTLPPGAAPSATIDYAERAQQKRKTSLSLLFGNFGRHPSSPKIGSDLPPSPRIPDGLNGVAPGAQPVSSPPSSASTARASSRAASTVNMMSYRKTSNSNGLTVPEPTTKSSGWSFGRRKSHQQQKPAVPNGVQRDVAPAVNRSTKLSKNDSAPPVPAKDSPKLRSGLFSFGRSRSSSKLTKSSNSSLDTSSGIDKPIARKFTGENALLGGSLRSAPQKNAAPVAYPGPPSLETASRRPPREAAPRSLASRY